MLFKRARLHVSAQLALWFGWILAVASVGSGRADTPGAVQPVRLAVLVVFDQMRGDYPARWQSLYSGGLRRLETEGAWFMNCNYPYACTVTAAGHASLATGCTPSVHGIVGNSWFERATQQVVTSVSENSKKGRFRLIAPGAASAADAPLSAISAEHLLAETIGDALREATNNKGRAVSLSLKTRSAVLMAGHRADACYWVDDETGLFTTTSYFPESSYAWIGRINATHPADAFLGEHWLPLGAPALYEKAFDHPVDGGLKRGGNGHFLDSNDKPAPGKKFYDALAASPFGNDLLFQAAQEAVRAEKLGQHEAPDLLCLSFSSNDLAGHQYGPDSPEILDITLRSDHLLGNLLTFLDQEVGQGKYLLAVSADHGVCPLPELANQGKGLYMPGATGMDNCLPAGPALAAKARRINPGTIRRDADAILNNLFPAAAGKKSWIVAEPQDQWLFLDNARIHEAGLEVEQVRVTLAREMRKLDYVLATYTREQMIREPGPVDQLGAALRFSFFPDRSGDVAIVLAPYCPLQGYPIGTNHGSPFLYDTHVPLFVFGPGVKKGARSEPVTPLAAAAILAHALGIAPPKNATVALPSGLFAER
jgi:hypothetical protein